MDMMDLRSMGFDPQLLSALHDVLDFSEEMDDTKAHHAPSRAYVRDSKAMRATPADILEYPDAYKFVVDMPGLKADQVKVTVEEGNTLVVGGERRREKDKEKKDVKYLRLERKLGKYLKKFVLPENADTDKVFANYQDGVLTVTVEKMKPPEPKQPKTIKVQAAS